ncbi:hypothetical protein RJ641_006478 [Dillenia turbinata]|uniref:Uncharacterized protein n=1 Tax=Dillenia turbinata TaxID=194707 RepID=A0AAN8Z7N3_9MAGN
MQTWTRDSTRQTEELKFLVQISCAHFPEIENVQTPRRHFLNFGDHNDRGVKQVEVNRKQSRVTVSGYVDPNKVLKRVRSTGKRAEFWPYIPYNLVSYPYATQAYDKRAPAGYVRNIVQALPAPNATDELITYFFSDDNPNACSIM